MTITALNEEFLFEKDLAELQKEIEVAKEELHKDLTIRITLNKIKEFMRKWKDFISKFDITHKRITVIEQTGKKLISFLQKKVNDLKKVKRVNTDDILPLQKYLDDFKKEIIDHIYIEKHKYATRGR